MSSKKNRGKRGARSRELRRQFAPTDDRAALWSELSNEIDLSIENTQDLRAKYNRLVKDHRILGRDYQRLLNHMNKYRAYVGKLHKDASDHKAGMITGGWVERFEPWSLPPLCDRSSRVELDRPMLAQYVNTLLQIRRITDEETGEVVLKGLLASGLDALPEDVKAYLIETDWGDLKTDLAKIALKLASELFRALAEWAIDHHVGMEFVPDSHDDGVNDPKVNGHRYELYGLNVRYEPYPDDEKTQSLAKMLLSNVLRRVYPSTLAAKIDASMLRVLLGEEAPLFRPKHLRDGRKGGHHKPAAGWVLRANAVGYMYYFMTSGMTKDQAAQDVADRYGVSKENIYSWEKRLPAVIGNVFTQNLYNTVNDPNKNGVFADKVLLEYWADLYRKYNSETGLPEIDERIIFGEYSFS